MRLRNKSLMGRVAAWLAAYAFVLQTALAPVAAAAATQSMKADALLVVCAEHAQAGDESLPASRHDHGPWCGLCLGCLSVALAAPVSFAVAPRDLAVIPLRWNRVSHFVSDKSWLAGKQARGPPTLT